jgi:hypothetical protein
MNKKEADGLKKISTILLKKYRYYKDISFGAIVWNESKSQSNKRLGNVYVMASLSTQDIYINISYKLTNAYTGNIKSIDYKIPLTTTPCRYGGKRYWLICPCYKSGKYCGRRVGTLYLLGDYFACRHCHNLTYSSRNENHRNRFTSLLNVLTIEQKIEDISKQIKRHSYNGKPTRNQKRIDKLYDRARKNYNNYERKK